MSVRFASVAHAMNRVRSNFARLALCFFLLFSLLRTLPAQPQEAISALRKEARAAAARGKAELAEEKYRLALAETPRDAGLDLEIARFLARQTKYPEAIVMYQRTLLLSPGNEAAATGLSESYRGVHNYEEARSILQAARRQHPKSVAVLSALGSLEIESESYDAAIEALRAALALAPDDVKLRNLLGTAYLGNGDTAAALVEFERVLPRDPGNQLAHYSRAQIFADMDQNERALADAEKVVAAKPEYLPGRVLLAKVLVRLKQCARAVEVLRPAVNPPVLETQALFLLGNAYECAGQPELAAGVREEFAAASQQDRRRAENETQSKHLVEQANALARQNQFTEALELLKQALEKNPKNGFAYSQQAKIYFSMRQVGQARDAIAQALAIQPYQPDFLYVAGVIAAQEGKQEEALAAFEKATQINPKEADAYFEIGKIWLQRNEREKALAAFRKASELDPGDAEYQRAVAETSRQEEPKRKN
jgi:tetratricopeptide (TPR) repeat protein